jgi:intein-encoded DNA endonuclease-like protein
VEERARLLSDILYLRKETLASRKLRKELTSCRKAKIPKE